MLANSPSKFFAKLSYLQIHESKADFHDPNNSLNFQKRMSQGLTANVCSHKVLLCQQITYSAMLVHIEGIAILIARGVPLCGTIEVE